MNLITFHGTGVSLRGISPLDKDGKAYATVWVTLVYLPIIPLKRRLIRFHQDSSSKSLHFASNSWVVLGETKLNFQEIIWTYLTPLLIGGPMLISTVQNSILHTSFTRDPGYFEILETLWVIIGPIVYLVHHRRKFSPTDKTPSLKIKDVTEHKKTFGNLQEWVKTKQVEAAVNGSSYLPPPQKRLMGLIALSCLGIISVAPVLIMAQIKYPLGQTIHQFLLNSYGQTGGIIMEYLFLWIGVGITAIPILFFVKQQVLKTKHSKRY